MDITGSIQLEGKQHVVEYEPGAMTGSKSLCLRIKGGNKNVPIYVTHIDEVIDMLRRGKKAIEALEKEE